MAIETPAASHAGPTLAHALQAAQQPPWCLDRLDAQLLLLHVLGRPSHDRGWLLAHDTDALLPEPLATYQTMCQRRSMGEPLAYIVGEKEFFGLRLKVNSAVLVPRPDTEILVEWALECGDVVEKSLESDKPLKVMDLGTGSGAIALALKSARPHWQITGLDASAEALAVAQHNGKALGLPVQWLRGHWLVGLQSQGPDYPGPFDLIVSNPPYIAPKDHHLAALHAEPKSALVAADEGMADLASIVRQAPSHLSLGAYVLLEHGYDQADAVQALLLANGFTHVRTQLDLAGVRRCTGGVWPPKVKPVPSPTH